MAYHYRSADRGQLELIPWTVGERLGDQDLVWFVLDVVDVIDTTEFHVVYANDGVGAPAYDPDVMLALLLYAYCLGVRSSRKIELLCDRDLGFMAIVGKLRPDHRTIAGFRKTHESAFAGVFCELLELCARAGLVSVGVIAIDGTKIAANASLQANRTRSWIEAEVERIMSEAAAADSQVVQPDLEGRLPAELADPTSRRARLQAALAQLEAERAAAEAEAARKRAERQADAERGRRPGGPSPKDPEAALEHAELQRTAARARQAAATDPVAKLQALSDLQRAETALTAATAAVTAADPKPEPQANITDPDSRIMATAKGWVQGYNAQAPANDRQIVLAALLSNHPNDVAELEPALAEMQANLDRVGVTEAVGVALFDAGYWSEHNATVAGPDRLIATQKDWKQRKAAREAGTTTGDPPEDATPLEQMEHRLRTPEGAATYARRSQIIEPVFGQIKENRSVIRFMRRGLDAARSEWQIICATHNLLKLHRHANGQTLHTIINPIT